MIPGEEIAELAELYDRFAHALDPFSKIATRPKAHSRQSWKN